ncbi:sensor histidine kinase [Domibacillus indicus]|uniref:sensor histidine kinase n=1 Tax=Domibacillus indicus TaxID=1437523 RepID=UPI001E5D8D52|nr:HAMP domain-containing sensor histidine kinase [Domibacillus indicus]
MFSKQSELYLLTKQDLIGNVINFLGSQIILVILYYVTYLRMKRQQEYYEQIQQSERIKTAGQLAAAVAHEIRNPLTVVKGFLQLYEQDSSYDRKAKEHFALMIDELDTAEKVISQFLSISAPNKEISLEKVNVKEILYSVVSLLNSYGLVHDNRIELELGEEECCIAADQTEVKQLCINLIKNAIEASKEGLPVLVKVKRMKSEVEIKIIDHGTGMSKTEIQLLGTPFYSLKSKGTGLGLMICFNIVKKYKGTIHFESVKEKGTTVVIHFPLYRELASREEKRI